MGVLGESGLIGRDVQFVLPRDRSLGTRKGYYKASFLPDCCLVFFLLR